MASSDSQIDKPQDTERAYLLCKTSLQMIRSLVLQVSFLLHVGQRRGVPLRPAQINSDEEVRACRHCTQVEYSMTNFKTAVRV